MDARKDQGPLLWGILLVAVGLLFLSANFGYGTWFNWDRWWPVVLIAIGLIVLYRRNQQGEPGAAPATEGSVAPGGPALPAAEQLSTAVPTPAAAAAQPAGRRQYPTGALILIGLGVAFLLDDVVGGNVLPAFVLIAVGIALVLRSRATP